MTAAVTVPRFDWGSHDGTLTAYVDANEVHDVSWFGTQSVEVAVVRAAETGRIATVTGPWGSGKTFAVARACETYVAVHDPDAKITYLRGAGLGRERQLYQQIFDGLTDSSLPGKWTAASLRTEIRRHLTEQAGVIVIDEAQRLTTPAQQAIQEVSDFAECGTGIVLIGDETLERNLIGEVLRRRPKDCRIRLKPVADDAVAEVVGQLHPILARTDGTVLRQLNQRAGGLLSRWAEIVGNTVALDIDTSNGIKADDIHLVTGAL